MDKSFKLFEADESNPIIPSMDQKLDEGAINTAEIKKQLKSNTELISEGLERAIGGDTVKSMMIPEDNSFILPNYLIDISKVEVFADHHSQALDALLDEDGDIVLYVNTASGEIAKIGRGLSAKLDRIIAVSIANLFSSKARVFKDFEPGKPLHEISTKNIETLRLDL